MVLLDCIIILLLFICVKSRNDVGLDTSSAGANRNYHLHNLKSSSINSTEWKEFLQKLKLGNNEYQFTLKRPADDSDGDKSHVTHHFEARTDAPKHLGQKLSNLHEHSHSAISSKKILHFNENITIYSLPSQADDDDNYNSDPPSEKLPRRAATRLRGTYLSPPLSFGNSIEDENNLRN